MGVPQVLFARLPVIYVPDTTDERLLSSLGDSTFETTRLQATAITTLSAGCGGFTSAAD